MAGFEHLGEGHVAEATDGGAGDVGLERASGVGVFEEEGDGVADPHFVPDADAHGCAFFGIYGLGAEVLLVETEVEGVALSEQIDNEGGGAELRREDVEAGFVEDAEHFAEQDVDLALALADDGEEAEEAAEGAEDDLGEDEQEHEEENAAKLFH
jgi:hypothetical protein